MRPLFSAIFILLFAAATIPDAAAQNQSTFQLGQFLSSVVDGGNGRVATVILDDHDDEGDDEARDRGREQTERGREGVGRGKAGRGAIEGRGGRGRDSREGRTTRGDDARAPSDRGDNGRQRSERADDAARERSERADDAREPSERGDRAEDGRDDNDSSAGRTNDDILEDGVNRKGSKRGNGPAFCRSGAGHPVFGPGWCHDKGFGIGAQKNENRRLGDLDEGPWNRRRDDRGNARPSEDGSLGMPSEDGGWLEDILGRRHK